MKLVNIGPLPYRDEPERSGGVIVLFGQWLDYCRLHAADSMLVDSNTHNYATRPAGYISVLRRVRRLAAPGVVLMLHGTAKDFLFFGPAVAAIARRRGAKLVLRKFAGHFDRVYAASSGVRRRLFDYVLGSAATSFWETRSLVEFGRKHCSSAHWFANTRPAPGVVRGGRPYEKRFVFLSRVVRMKGIPELVECFRNLPQDYTLDIYGAPEGDVDVAALDSANCRYRGCVEPQRVPEVLARYDVLLLPTHYTTEGYPGVITEAFSVGLPVVATRMGGIPEMIQHGRNGLLLDAPDAYELRRTIEGLDADAFARLSAGAAESFACYEASRVNAQVLEILNAL